MQEISAERRNDFQIQTWENEVAKMLAELKKAQKLSDSNVVHLINQALRMIGVSSPGVTAAEKPTVFAPEITQFGNSLAQLLVEINKTRLNSDPRVAKIFQDALEFATTKA